MSIFDFPPESTKIRFLEPEPKYSGVMIRTYDSFKIMQPKGVIKLHDFDESHVSKSPRLSKVPLTAREIIGSILPDIPYSRHRSKRVLKKLHKKLARPLYSNPFILHLPPKVVEAINGLAKRKPKRNSQRDILDRFEFSHPAD